MAPDALGPFSLIEFPLAVICFMLHSFGADGVLKILDI